jgi:phosphate/sulfate permease
MAEHDIVEETTQLEQLGRKSIPIKDSALAGTVIIWFLLLLVSQHLHINLVVPSGLLLMFILAYCNGANDVSKAIATLVGSGVTNYRRAILFGSTCTVIGACLSTIIAAGLVTTFTKGLIAGSTHLTGQFALAALLGAIAWVYLATRLALPVSTTHAITGSVVTAGAFAFGIQHVLWGSLGTKILLPLLVSLIAAFALGIALFRVLRLAFSKVNLNGAHWLSSGVASFTRGLNDTPKIVALGSVLFLLDGAKVAATTPIWLFLAVALAMGIGSIIGGLRVTQTLAEKVTKMNHQEGFAANLATALLVGASSVFSLPVSTTQVSSCAIIGIGIRKGWGSVCWRTVWDMVLAWMVTLPVAGILATIAYFVLDLTGHM